jgi:NTP pyrophosphatase (non-canonical NTP hydrolase)
VDQVEQPSEQLLRQVMSDVEELVARHLWETAPRARMAFLLGETLELAEEILRLPEAGPYETSDSQRLGLEIYDVLWNACAVAGSVGVDVVRAAAEKRAINQGRQWPIPQEDAREFDADQ